MGRHLRFLAIGAAVAFLTTQTGVRGEESFSQTLHTIRAQPAISTAYDFMSVPPDAGHGMTIAIIGEGVQKTLAASLGPRIRLYSFHPTEPDAYYDVPTGDDAASASDATSTAVALIAAVAPGARLLSIKVMGGNGTGDYADIGKGIAFAVKLHPNIIVFLGAGGDGDPSVTRPLETAIAQGILVITPAGNDSKANVVYPGTLDGVVPVGATDVNDALGSFSSYGSKAIYAPGVDIKTVVATGYSEGKVSGTSMSAAMAASLFAVLWAVNPKLSRAKLVSIVIATATPITIHGSTGLRIDAQKALVAVKAARPSL